jgi:uncharacterized protein (TIGR02466 family)
MKTFNLFPSIIGAETLDNINDKELFDIQKTLNEIPYHEASINGSTSKDQRLLDIPTFQKLKNKILNSSRKYLNHLGHIYEDIQILNSWANIIKKNQFIQNHYHANSYISGVFYVGEGSNIVFKNPLEALWSFTSPTTNDNINTVDEIKIKPESKLLLLFPSFLQHSVDPSLVEKSRYSIAFNVIPKGEFGNNTSKLYL